MHRVVTIEADYTELLVTHQPAKPRTRQELAEMTALLESLAANETPQSPAMERFIETLTALILQYEEEIEPGPDRRHQRSGMFQQIKPRSLHA